MQIVADISTAQPICGALFDLAVKRGRLAISLRRFVRMQDMGLVRTRAANREPRWNSTARQIGSSAFFARSSPRRTRLRHGIHAADDGSSETRARQRSVASIAAFAALAIAKPAHGDCARGRYQRANQGAQQLDCPIRWADDGGRSLRHLRQCRRRAAPF